MITPRRALTAALLAVGAGALAAPAAQAAPITGGEPISPIATLDHVSTLGIPAEHRGELPTAGQQLGGLNQLNQLHQLTDLAAPVTNAVPAVG
ncbi:hypothetical protein GTW43_13155 [Streptomyces sp. SID5785]|uniref:hypothetical protein n=1 Tax=Streptomyces sp. SID5785 TaxID=2690309 RepID=UPI001361D4FD|nr:hypothetical protein [Streptomyces sp. SID5785]MZD06029.1 hypothetical protein [Streptomyces sp. SID5785]